MTRLLHLLAVLLTATFVVAHMGVDPPEAPAGESSIIAFRIGHDCGDDTVGTTNFTLEMPSGLDSVSVEQKSGWRIFIHKATLTTTSNPPAPVVDSEELEYVRAVTFIGFLPDDFYQLFNMRIRFPPKKGEVFYFKGYQDCHNQGTSIAWATIPDKEDPAPRYPAVSVTTV